MTQRDIDYYKDMKGPRKMVCENRCDPIFYLTWLKQQKELERQENWEREKQNLFRFRDLNAIKSLLIERGEQVSDDSEDDEQQQHVESLEEVAEVGDVTVRVEKLDE